MKKPIQQKIVIKIGTNVITREDGLLDLKVMQALVTQVATLKQQKVEVVLVTSGAMGSGRALVKNNIGNPVVRRQVLASVGQVKLMETYAKLFNKHDYLCAQVLATKEDFRDRKHYLNMKNCLEALLKNNIVPIINENDVVSVTELMFTDNDELAGLLSAMLNVDSLLLLSDVKGVFDKHPEEKDARLISVVDPLKTDTSKYISHKKSLFGRGGMFTKHKIARKLSQLGITTYIAAGKEAHVITDIVLHKLAVGTKFIPQKKVSGVKKWIASTEGQEKGTVYVNKCAAEILMAKKAVSLLPIGITKIEGNFQKGDIIKIKDEQGREIGLGTAQYGVEKAKEFIGQKGKKPLIHYNYLFLKV